VTGGAAAVAFRGVSFAYPRAERRGGRPFSVEAIDFEVRPGEILGVIGPNSAGKTTLLRLLTRLVTPGAGDIVVDGRPLASFAPRDLARHVAVVPQELPQGFPFTVEELVLMGRYPHGAARLFEDADDRRVARDAMAVVGVADIARAPLDELSGGERQRAVLARALAQQPRLLALDEPTAHLDLKYQAACGAIVRRLARERSVGVLLVSHDLNFAAELADRLLLLAEGRVVAVGPPGDVLQTERLERAFGARMVVERVTATARPFVQVTIDDAPAGREGR